MKLEPLGHGFCRVFVELDSYLYYFRGILIPEDLLSAISDCDNPCEADAMTCEMTLC